MGTSTSNQDLGITTKTSDHVAKTEGATDVCWNPPVKVQVPHSNEVATTLATEHTTDKTKFGAGQVVREGDAIGPPSGPAHPDNGAGGGVKSHTHLQEARVTTGSPNVQTEGKPVARNTDPTTQNHANTTGKITGGDPNDAQKRLEQEKKKACTLDTTRATCAHGRDDGSAAGKDKLLEVTAMSGDKGFATPCSIKLVAKRKNAKEASKGPECEPGDHTKWIVQRWKSGKKEREATLIGDEQYLEESWFSWNMGNVSTSESSTTAGDKTKELKKQAFEKIQSDYNARRASEGLGPKDLKPPRGRQQANQQAAAGQAARERTATQIGGVQAVAALGMSIVQFVKVWNAYNDPIEVKVDVLACSGGDKYIFRSVPSTNASFKLEGAELEKVKAACATIERFVKIFQKLASLAGLPANFGLKLCDMPNVEFGVQWEELKEDSPAIKKYKHHVDRKWELTFEFKKLVEWTGEFGIPIAYFANLFIPGAGSALSSALNYIGLEANVGVKVDFCIVPKLFANCEAGQVLPNFGGTIEAKLDLFFRVKVAWRSCLEVAGGAVFEFTFSGGAEVKTRNLWDFEVKVAGEMKVGFKGLYRVDILWWEKADTISYYPEQCKFKLFEFPFKPLALLKG